VDNTKIYVGNIGFNVTNEALTNAFAKFGQVRSAKIITDRDTNRSKGFGFVEMGTGSEAAKAISSLNGTDLDGRALNVTEARPKN
jgi:RNA recognition motif-containing protein